MTSPATIYYHPEAYSTDGPKLMGRHAAGASFLRGYASHALAPEFRALVDKKDQAAGFASTIRQYNQHKPILVVPLDSIAHVAESGTLFVPGPGIGTHAWHRAPFGSRSWSVCGITHTTASANAMDGIADWLTAPVEPWDAVICTSSAVRAMVETLLDAQAEHLRARLAATRVPRPRLPVIPLGVSVADFAFTDDQRRAARTTLGLAGDEIAVLFLGRLSFHSKAHPLAMYQALERAAPGHKVVLIECGWTANDAIADAFAEAQRAACPSVRVVTLDGRDAKRRADAWAAADVFCSLSDNIQETFGLAPVEAMAAGLPVVVSDWDGYKETVRDGIDGFRVPTLMPAAGSGLQLAIRHGLGVDSYDTFLGLTSALVAVDVDAAVSAFRQLFAYPELRRQMGEAGRGRALALYDWSAIIPAYEAFWDQLGEERRRQDPAPPRPQPWPARMDPFTAFAGYPTRMIGESTVFALAAGDPAAALARMRALRMVAFANAVMPTDAETAHILAQLTRGPRTAAELVSGLPPQRQAAVQRALAWLVKMGALSAP